MQRNMIAFKFGGCCSWLQSLITVVKKIFGDFTAKNRIKRGGEKQRNECVPRHTTRTFTGLCMQWRLLHNPLVAFTNVPPHTPVSPPIHRRSAVPVCIVRLPSLSEPRCLSCVPPACSTPAPLCRPYPFPWWPSHHSVFHSVPVSHLSREAMCSVWGGGGVFADWTVAPPEGWHDAGHQDSTTAMFLTLSTRVNSSQSQRAGLTP